MELRKYPSVGEILIQQGVITKGQLTLAENEKKSSGNSLGKVLVNLGFIDEKRLLEVQSDSLNIPFIELKDYPVNPELIRRLPESLARRHRAIVLKKDSEDYQVGVVDPFNLFAIDEIKRILGNKVKLALVRENEMISIFDSIYHNEEAISNIAQELETNLTDAKLDFSLNTLSADQSDAPVVRFIENVFHDAIKSKASDIHIEPEETQTRIRLRIDGILHERIIKEKRAAAAIVMRLKLMSDLDISEKRVPQDGRFQMTVKGRRIDVRISTMPTQFGESVVMRLLDQTEINLDIKGLGMPAYIEERFTALIQRPHGMILVTGPTGSGKTTTLYSALNNLNTPERKIITAEDPVEYRLERINQVQVNPKVGLTFASVLRAALRQDPDIVLLGEIRDSETSEIALKAAMTGHLVLSTLHTNDAISSAFRLIDLGVQPFVVGYSLLACMAQRLVRTICPQCKETHTPDSRQLALLQSLSGHDAEEFAQAAYYRGRGCHYCHNTGYRGRRGAYELLEMDDTLASALQQHDSALFIQSAQKQIGYEPLSKCALRYAVEGITTLDEAFRLATSDRMLVTHYQIA